jgi:hypothetical protein
MDVRCEVLVGGHGDPRVNGNSLGPSQPLKAHLLDDP